MSAAADTVTFAGLDRPTAPLGVGTWAWGDESTWGMGSYDLAITETTIGEAFEAALAAGVTLFDTAEVYGGGESERIIGRLLASRGVARDDVVLATKFMPSPWKLNVKAALRSALEGSLQRLGVERVELYQIHGPISLRSHAALADALAAVHADGLVGAVGVSNYSIREMESIHTQLTERGVPLASNQIEFSILRRKPETSGLLDACRRLGVVPLAYSPIGQGRLTGKYSAAHPPPSSRKFSAHPMELVDPIVDELRAIGGAHEAKTPSQVALRWIIEKGAVPIPGAKNAEQARQNAGALGWALTADDVARIDAVALDGKVSLQSRVWQHGERGPPPRPGVAQSADRRVLSPEVRFGHAHVPARGRSRFGRHPPICSCAAQVSTPFARGRWWVRLVPDVGPVRWLTWGATPRSARVLQGPLPRLQGAGGWLRFGRRGARCRRAPAPRRR